MDQDQRSNFWRAVVDIRGPALPSVAKRIEESLPVHSVCMCRIIAWMWSISFYFNNVINSHTIIDLVRSYKWACTSKSKLDFLQNIFIWVLMFILGAAIEIPCHLNQSETHRFWDEITWDPNGNI